VLLLPGFAPARALHRRAGRHQRRQELSGDGDSIYRLFYDTVKGGDFRSREANVYRLAQISVNIIDQCVAQGVPFAREYGGMLDNRSFGGAQVSRTFYARGQTGQQLLLGAYQALERQIGAGQVKMYPRHEMLDLVVIDGHARGIVTRDLVTGKIESYVADAVVLGTGGYGNAYYLSTNAKGCNATAIWRAYKKGALFANPCFTQIHPTCIPVTGEYQSKLTLMSESLRNDGRIWVPLKKGDKRPPNQIPGRRARLLPGAPLSELRQPGAARRGFPQCQGGLRRRPRRGRVRPGRLSRFQRAIERLGKHVIKERYGNLFDMYERITGENPYEVPMRIYPAIHYTMGGLWVDYNLMSTIPGLYVIGEANFSDHGANRLGASALMQGLADGYFVLPYTIGDYLATSKLPKVDTSHAPSAKPKRRWPARPSACSISKARARWIPSTATWASCFGNTAAWRAPPKDCRHALEKIPALREQFWRDVKVLGTGEELNQSLEKAGRVGDFFELPS
jgi:succinate dehydrogenase / fumarate reductase flavoprotein subunit